MKTILKLYVALSLAIMPWHCALAQDEATLSEAEKEEIAQDVKNSVDDFISYLPEIAAKSGKGAEAKRKAILYKKRALKLFIGEGEKYWMKDNNGNFREYDPVTMQTTSKGVKNRPKKLTLYLDRLMALPYHTVQVDTCSAVKLTKDFHKIGENRWTCTAYFIQAFRASNAEGKLIINDKDPKKVTVYIDREEIFNPETGEVKAYFNVQLGDICIYSDYNYVF